MANYVNICSLVNKCNSSIQTLAQIYTHVHIILYTRLIIIIIVASLSKQKLEISFE